MTISIIAARSVNNVIGKDGKIPWKIKGEQEQFKRITKGKIVVMGRRTFEEINRPLPEREIIVVSKTKNFIYDGVSTVESLDEALEIAKEKEKDVVIAGGYNLYKEALPIADILYLTEIKIKIEGGDTFFPYFDESNYGRIIESIEGTDIKYVRTTYVKKC